MKQHISIIFGLAIACATAASGHAEEVVIGAALPLTGNVATWAGQPVANGILLATDEVNANHEAGEHTLKVLVEDMASDRTQGITLASRFINSENVSMIIGYPSSIHATAVAPLVNQAETPLISVAVSKAVTGSGPWAFKLWQASDVPADALSDLVVNNLKPKTIAIVFNRDNDAYVEMAKIARKKFQDAGIDIVADEGTLITDTNFTALSSKVASLKPQVLFLSGVAESMANVVVQAKQAGLSDDVQIVGMPGLAPPAYERIGGKAIDGSIFTGNYFLNAPQATNQHFVDAYRKRYGHDPDEFGAAGYTLVKLAALAVKSGGGDHEKIRQALNALNDVPVVIGNGTFSIDKTSREPTYGSMLLQWKDGKVVAYQQPAN